jgi:hypothetical protein
MRISNYNPNLHNLVPLQVSISQYFHSSSGSLLESSMRSFRVGPVPHFGCHFKVGGLPCPAKSTPASNSASFSKWTPSTQTITHRVLCAGDIFCSPSYVNECSLGVLRSNNNTWFQSEYIVRARLEFIKHHIIYYGSLPHTDENVYS